MSRVLIIGTGDVAKRILPLLVNRCQVFAVVRHPERAAWWREHGATPIMADLDHPKSCQRLYGLVRTSQWVIYLAPPADAGGRNALVDTRMRRLLAFQQKKPVFSRAQSLAQRWVYISTTGVYGDLHGAWGDETALCSPVSARGKRRLDAENRLRRHHWPAMQGVSILRVPGIYAADRLPFARLKAHTPVLSKDEDVFTNHIHAEDLAKVVMAALRRGKSHRVYHAVDDSCMQMGDYFDAVADAFGFLRPPRVSRAMAETEISPAMLSFMSESRRLKNHRMKNELQIQLRYPSVLDGIKGACAKISNE